MIDISCKFILGCGLAVATLIPPGTANAKSKETVLFSFRVGHDGAYPNAGLIMDQAANLYGTTIKGGSGGSGTVFEVPRDGTQTRLYSFCSRKDCSDGAEPSGSLIMDKNGNLYGTTQEGGTSYGGTVFKLTPDGTETVLYLFCSQVRCTDGAGPVAGLIMDKAGNLYGTTSSGGASESGTVFEVAPNGTETVLYSFCSVAGCPDGSGPVAGLITDKAANLYGTTGYGGPGGGGTVFEVTPNGTETVLYSFCRQTNCIDGSRPGAGLIKDKVGNLYGTTESGGADGQGTVFKLAPDGTEAVLYSFANGRDGTNPYAGLVTDKKGNLYGTTEYGGDNGCVGGQGCGTIFELAPDGTETVLHTFKDQPDGANPAAGLIMDSLGNLYGTTYGGGAYGLGTVFRLEE